MDERQVTQDANHRASFYEIRELLAKGDLLKSVKLLRLAVIHDIETSNDAIQLSHRVYALRKRIIRGNISWEDEREERNRIVGSILDMIEELEDDGI